MVLLTVIVREADILFIIYMKLTPYWEVACNCLHVSILRNYWWISM